MAHDLLANLLVQLQDFMALYEYEPLPEWNQYRRSVDNGFQCLILSATSYPDGAMLEAHIGMRHDQVESLVFPLLNGRPGFEANSMTLVTSLSRLFEEDPGRYWLTGPEEEQQALEQIKERLVQRGFSLLRQLQSLQALDELFNAHPMQPLKMVHNQQHRCFRGLAIAKLNQRPDFFELAGMYRNQLYRLGAQSRDMEQFERLTSFLHTYSAN
jgi:hypothetical protein